MTTVVRFAATRSNVPAIRSNRSLFVEPTRSAPRTFAICSSVSRIGPSGFCANSRQALEAIVAVCRFSRPLNSRTSLDFPIPGSPPTSTSPPCPSPACRRRCSRCSSSADRPMNGRQTIRVETTSCPSTARLRRSAQDDKSGSAQDDIRMTRVSALPSAGRRCSHACAPAAVLRAVPAAVRWYALRTASNAAPASTRRSRCTPRTRFEW